MSKFNFTVIKTNRFDSILAALPTIIRGFNTIHLLRDPCGMFASMFGYLDKENTTINTFKFAITHIAMECSKNERNFRFHEEVSKIPEISAFFNAHFRLVRYEDISYNTLSISRAMFDFAKLHMTMPLLKGIIRLAKILFYKLIL